MNTRITVLFAGLCLALLGWVGNASANTLSISYYTIASSDPDINTACCGTYNNEVMATLGPDGLPVLNTSYGGPTIHDVNANGELTWWSPADNSNVHYTGSSTVTLPFNVPANFFPPNGTGVSDANGYQAAVLSGTITLATDSLVSFSIGADDSAFAYLDGSVVCDLGGVHAFTVGSCSTLSTVSAGTHTLQVFFDDLNAVQSGLEFDITTQGVTTTSVPEPTSLALVGLALVGVVVGAQRRK